MLTIAARHLPNRGRSERTMPSNGHCGSGDGASMLCISSFVFRISDAVQIDPSNGRNEDRRRSRGFCNDWCTSRILVATCARPEDCKIGNMWCTEDKAA